MKPLEINIDKIVEKVKNKKRIEKEEALILYKELSLTEIGSLAHELRNAKTNPKEVTYIVDRNINYTNICAADCHFCSFYRRINDKDAYVIKEEVLAQKLQETVELGGTGILIQGGLHPKLRLDYYKHLLSFIKKTAPSIHIHGFSPPEIVFLRRLEKKTLKEILISLKESGLDSIPGGGAEILVDSVRKKISKGKCSSQEWLDVMETAHSIGLKTTATMMFGHLESIEDRIEHLYKIRSLQDKTKGFTAFIPWTYQENKDSVLKIEKKIFSYSYLKTLALSRIFLDNFQNIQGSWLTQGIAIGQMSLFFGANDLGSIMIEENVVRAAGTKNKINEKELIHAIEQLDYKAVKRRTLYEKF